LRDLDVCIELGIAFFSYLVWMIIEFNLPDVISLEGIASENGNNSSIGMNSTCDWKRTDTLHHHV
jgi:hypothetical protein